MAKEKSLSDRMDDLGKSLLGHDAVTFFERVRDGQSVKISPGAVARYLVEALSMAYDFEQSQGKKIASLQSEILDLKRSLCLDSSNSHKPPSSDGLKKKKVIKNSREKSGKKPGGQPKHSGKAHELHPGADHVQRFEPTRCSECQRDLKDAPEHEVVRKQTIELKDGRTHITEYQTVIKFCPDCGQWNRGRQPPELQKSRVVFGPFAKSVALYFMSQQLIPVARTQEILRDLFNLPMSTGTLGGLVREFGHRLRVWEVQTRAQLLSSPVLHADETGIRCEKRMDYVHGYSTSEATLLTLHPKRGLEAMKEIGFLGHYSGHLVHDAFSAYFRYGMSHSLCNAHILRDLKYLTEEEDQKWSARMAEFLKKTLRNVHRNRHLQKGWAAQVRIDYRSILRQGYQENGHPTEWRGRPPDGYKNRWDEKTRKTLRIPYRKQRAHGQPMKLLNRLRDREKEILAFATGLRARRLQAAAIPFTNNQIERDLRMLKLKQKISGCFRSAPAARMFLRIYSFLSTIGKQNLHVLTQIRAQLEAV